MTRVIASLSEIVEDHDVFVLDQWGVLHDGKRPYPKAIAALEMLLRTRKPVVVLSNSGKRAAPNLQRISRFGIPLKPISCLITSGELLWRDLLDGSLRVEGRRPRRLYTISATREDATAWARGIDFLNVNCDRIEDSDAVLIMGVRDGHGMLEHRHELDVALGAGRTVICSNPDKASPREGGQRTEPGILAEHYLRMGGEVIWYGKPHRRVFDAVRNVYPEIPGKRFLMVGDSFEHDIVGAAAAGMSTAFVQGGLFAGEFPSGMDRSSVVAAISRFATEHGGGISPDISLPILA